MTTLVLLGLLTAAPDAGTGINEALFALRPLRGASLFGRPEDEVVSLGRGVTTVKTNEDYHWSACGYAMYFHHLVVERPDAGWTGFLGYSGGAGCDPPREWNDVDEAEVVPGGVRLTSRFPKGANHRAGRGAQLTLVPYQDFAVPKEIGPVTQLMFHSSKRECLRLVDRKGVFFEMSGWCLPTRDAVTCLALQNRCTTALDAEGFEFTWDAQRYRVVRGCVIPRGEHALVVGASTRSERPQALTFWTARCPTVELGAP